MTVPETSLEAAQKWCLNGQLPGPLRPPDETLEIINTTTLQEELDVAARKYRQAVSAGADTVYFAVRDRRAPRERIVTGLRGRGVPIGDAPGLDPGSDPVVTELLEVAKALFVAEEEGDLPEGTIATLADRTDPSIDAQSVLDDVWSASTLVEALDQWIDQTNLLDRLMRAERGLYRRGHPLGTVKQRASARHLTEIREVARYLDTLRQADLSLPEIGPEVLVTAIEESVMEEGHPLLATSDQSTDPDADTELIEMAELKVTDVADTVIVLEATEELLDANPNDQQFIIAPRLSDHPDMPGATAVAGDRARRQYGQLPNISDGRRAWFVGLGRRHLGNTLAGASDKAVICTRQSIDTRPSRTVIELRDRLGLSFRSDATSPDPADEAGVGSGVQDRIERFRDHINSASSAECDDAAPLVEHLQADIREGRLSDAQLSTVLRLLSDYRQLANDPADTPNHD